MHKIEKIYCPNCGGAAERFHITHHDIVQTQCPNCDYFLSTCARTGAVLETYGASVVSRRR